MPDSQGLTDGPQRGRAFAMLFRAGAIAAAATVIVTIVQIILGVVWPPPDFAPTAAVAESMLRLVETGPFRAFVTLDGLMVLDYLLLIVVYLALFAALRDREPSLITLGTGLALVAITLYFTANPSITMFVLAEQYSAGMPDATGVVTAAQGVLATFEGTAFIVHYIVMGVAGILVSIAMLRGQVFSRATGIAGVAQGAMMLVPVTFGMIGLVFAVGSLVPFIVWFILVARRLGRMATEVERPDV
ncbi:MAG: DUF4386 family protein [Coriobacteriia bacterium]|nr:DUF4386 family protein [Coriobacteriia bacterium]